jgi:hypothetical protein
MRSKFDHWIQHYAILIPYYAVWENDPAHVDYDPQLCHIVWDLHTNSILF